MEEYKRTAIFVLIHFPIHSILNLQSNKLSVFIPHNKMFAMHVRYNSMNLMTLMMCFTVNKINVMSFSQQDPQ